MHQIRIHWIVLLLLLGCILGGCDTQAKITDEKGISLAGTWRFGLDPEDKGIQEHWYGRTPAERIMLPGTLQGQDYGNLISTETPWVLSLYDRNWYLRKEFKAFTEPGNVKVPFVCQPPRHYLGPAWYQRTIEIPAGWQGRRIGLFLERAHWKTTVWVDENEIGSRDSLVAPHVYELGMLPAGTYTLTVRIDNRMQMDYRPDGHSVSDSLGNTWNGIAGRIELFSTTPVWLDQVRAFPNILKKSVCLKVDIGNSTQQPGKGIIQVGRKQTAVSWTAEGGQAEIEVELGEDAELWSEFNPALHHLTVHLEGEQADDSRTITFGLRQISTDGYHLLVNGRRSHFRGTHSGGDFPLTGYPATDVDYWRKLFKICREWGLNHVRFHSYCPPEAAFETADELGMYLQPEAGMWNAISPGTDMEKRLYEETDRMLRVYGNHPSFVLFSPSNEPAGRWKEALTQWVEHYREKDPRRLYTPQTGWPLIDRPGPVEGADFLAAMRIGRRRVRGNSAWFGRNFSRSVRGVDVPVISHELGQWCAFPDFDVIEKFTGYMRPGNYQIFQALMDKAGLLDKDKALAQASGHFQAACYKEEIEANLRTPGLAGFQLLDLHDYVGQGTALVGVLDPFWEPKGYITAQQWRRFCNKTVPLALLRKRVFTTDDSFDVEIQIAHYGQAPIENAALVWQIRDAQDHVAREGKWNVEKIDLGSAISLGQVEVDLSTLKAPGMYRLVVGLYQTNIENDWDFWLYPEDIPQEVPSDTLMTRSFEEAAEALKKGQKVFFMPRYNELQWSSPPIGQLPIFWNRLMGPKWERFLGLLCDTAHPSLSRFPTDSWYDWQWEGVFGRYCRAINMDSLPKNLEPVVQVIDDWNRNYKLGALFECRVGQGKLLVCAADLESRLENRPAAAQLRRSLLDYMSTDALFDPPVECTPDQFMSLRFDNRLMDKLAATATAAAEHGADSADNAIDGNPNTYWSTVGRGGSSGYPHELIIHFPQPVRMSGLVLMNRQDHRQRQGDIQDISVEMSADGQLWQPVYTGQLESTFDPQQVDFGKEITIAYLKLRALSGFGEDRSAALAEIAVVYTGPSLTGDTKDESTGYGDAATATEEMVEAVEDSPSGNVADKPLYRDPVYDGATDPVLVWNKQEQKWFMFYTSRRANVAGLSGVSWVHGSPIGIAESAAGGATWTYRQNAAIDYKKGNDTYWAPEVIEHDGTYHMYLTYVPGIFDNWLHPRHILHLTSKNLLDWEYQSTLKLANDKVIDACVFRLSDGTWRMWYNNEMDNKSIYYADSSDLYTWQDKGKAIGDRRGEGPKVFRWKDHLWMVVDNWDGLGVYRSEDGQNWAPQAGNLLRTPGTGADDGAQGHHADVVVSDDRAYLFYFTHPGRQPGAERSPTDQRHSSIQVVELAYKDGRLTCDRNEPTLIDLKPEQ